MLATLALAVALQAPTTAVIVQVEGRPQFAEMTRDEARSALVSAVRKVLEDNLTKAKVPVVTAGAEPTNFDRQEFERIAITAGAQRIVVVRLLKWNQRNRSMEEIGADPNRGGSQTSVEVRFWKYERAMEALTVPDSNALKGSAKGPFFGTTDRSDMSGPPDAKTLEIRNTNRQRMAAIGRATWSAIQPQLGL